MPPFARGRNRVAFEHIGEGLGGYHDLNGPAGLLARFSTNRQNVGSEGQCMRQEATKARDDQERQAALDELTHEAQEQGYGY